MEPHCPTSSGMLIFLLLFQMKKHVLELDSNKELSYDEQDEASIGELPEFIQRVRIRCDGLHFLKEKNPEGKPSKLEMELFALGANGFLDEILQKVR
uniref:Uncharacterized protein n=1 Tax=Salix viminalis TaxID=40686 RepID=A0A6N2LF79_SALVM